ncbi:hypothetical protein [Xanthomonas theicola]|uniref:hypothetical protein n=1 Tax=Xanthomonas theicola TaxID=56464 RepID=UPI000FF8AC3E|nr:hypothetical protein [Xanthomonas theicola]QNH23616.1 hypothetical protein G4Q83_00910 [Xanthomonas theicola]
MPLWSRRNQQIHAWNSPLLRPCCRRGRRHRHSADEAPDHLLRSIRAGWIAAALTALASLILGLAAVRLGNAAVGIGTLVESLIFAGLGYGIHRKSRACAAAVCATTHRANACSSTPASSTAP